MSKLKLNNRFLVSGVVIVAMIVLISCVYLAGMNSGVEATSTNSDCTISETEDGVAFHEPNDSWVYGKDEYSKLIPYEEETNNIQEDTSNSNENYLGNSDNDSEYNSNNPGSIDTGCDIGYDIEKGNLEVVSFSYENGEATYKLYDYSTDLTFTVTLNHYGVIAAY